ncbi:MAG: 16S rRNA processing protein RimM [Gammaproteobacteria bacterium]|jgi:16S rRNA processing protein RimM
MTTSPTDMVVIGKITSVYGVKGWVKIHSYTDPIENFLGYQDCYLDRGDQWEPLDFEAIKLHGKGLVALIDGLSDREEAKRYCQCDVAVRNSELPKLNADEFYWYQLEGLQVSTSGDNGQDLLLGEVDHVMETGANDVLVVRKSKGSIDKAERLIPWIKDQVIKSVDLELGVIRVDWDPEF